MKLIVGLGNPGKIYQETWHNLGFLATEKLLQSMAKAGDFKNRKKIKAEAAEVSLGEDKIILARPQTFMNNSGQAVKAMLNFYKIPAADLWVIHDDIDIPLGKIRISQGATAAGHKGVQSIINEIGTKQFVRFRIGIKSEEQGRIPTEDYVLQKISQQSKVVITKSIERTAAAIKLALTEDMTAAMNGFN